MSNSSNKRILKNTIFLYFRMIVVMGVTLYTSRLILQILGAEDYGIYNVIGGVVAMLMFLNSTLTSTCQRYFSSAIGKGDEKEIKNLFNTIMTLYVVFVAVVLLGGETIGLWFVNNKLVIPENRMFATNWVYQITLLTVISNSISIPYRSLVISYEKMSFFAYISILEVILKLALVFLLFVITIDKLIAYAFFMFLVHLSIGLGYYFYCKKKYSCGYFKLVWDKKMLADIGSYSGWHLFGAVSVIIRNQGVNVLLNTFFNPVVNAARGISYQVMTAAGALTNNFFTAVQPQIYKLYATEEKEKMHLLMDRSSKVCYLLVGILAFPILFNLEAVLALWLTKIPSYTIEFTQLTLVLVLIESINGPSVSAALATGKIKWYEIITSFIMMGNLPISYMVLNWGYSPESVMVVSVAVSSLTIFIRGYILQRFIDYNLFKFTQRVIYPILLSSLLTYIVLIPIMKFLPNVNIWMLLVRLILCFFVYCSVSYCFLLNKRERHFLIDMVKERINK